MSGRFNILSLSGGGFLGLYTVCVLTELEEAAGGPLARHFDLMAGTSVGGIIALGLAAEVPAATIKTAFERHGRDIFSNRPAPTSWWGTVRDLARFMHKPKYQAEALRRTIVELVGEGTRIGELMHPVIVPTINLTRGKPQIFKTPHYPECRTDPDLKVVDVALATAAAPTYFPIAEIGDSLFADGGLYATSPDLIAVHEAQHVLERPDGDLHLLSVGTATSRFSFTHATRRLLGSFGWLRDQRLVNVIIASQQCAVADMLQQRLGDRYLRLDADRSKEQQRQLAIDVATDHAQKALRDLAAATMQSHINNDRLKEFFFHTAPVPLFHRRPGD
jgi:predicted acylesterase/phospholipase RssA